MNKSFVKFKESIACESLWVTMWNDKVIDSHTFSSCEEQSNTRNLSEILNLNIITYSKKEISEYLRGFIAFYFGYQLDRINDNTSIINDLEVHLYSNGGTEPLKYGEIFIDMEKPENSGLSDQGLSKYLFFNDLSDAMGFDAQSKYGDDIYQDKLWDSDSVYELKENLINFLNKYNKINE